MSTRHQQRVVLARIVAIAAVAATAVSSVLTSTASAAPTTAAPAAGNVSTVRLITGDTVTLRQADGRTSLSIASPSGSTSGYSQMQAGRAHYVIPPVARYYGQVFDPSLFDLSAASSTVTVDVAYTGAQPSVPGLVVTSLTSGTLHGYLSAAGTQTFGVALRRQYLSDLHAGLHAPTTVFGANRITALRPVVAQPNYPQSTLVIDAINTDGSPLRTAAVGLVNTDDGRKYNSVLFLNDGQVRASVPVGNYSLIAEADNVDPDDGSLRTAFKTIPDFSVTAPGQNITVDFRGATASPSIRTPQPASLLSLWTEYVRVVPNSPPLTIGFTSGPADVVKIAPASQPVHGDVHWVKTWALAGTPTRATGYRYDASYDDHGAIPVDQSAVFDQTQAARVDAYFYSDEATQASYARAGFYPFDTYIILASHQQPAPLAQTQYLVGSAAMHWLDTYVSHPSAADPAQGAVADSARLYASGSRTRIDWLRGPLAPGADEPTPDATFYSCQACRTPTQMVIGLDPIVDSTPGHAGFINKVDPDTVVTAFDLYRDGKLIGHQDDSTGGVFAVPSSAASYRAVVTTDLRSVGYIRSTHAVTELTFPSAAGQGGATPSNWACSLSEPCRVLPLMTASVPLPTDLTDTLAQGTSAFIITLDGTRGSTAGPATSASMSINVGGRGFKPVPLTALGHGRFRVAVTHAPTDAGKHVSIRLSGRDAYGDGITQTITDAYAVANTATGGTSA